ncbi:MAG: glycosyltransferase family 2 protein [Bacteroidales bacterium]|nr:glycosyltransferase family 2 protein [Bacteroidales bacterium]
MTKVISYIALVFAGLRLLVALVNFLYDAFRRRQVVEEEEFISVLIPARNEEANIGNLLDKLRLQDYKNMEIIVLDDNSDDATASVVSEKAGSDERVRLVFNDELPGGWSGKNYACYRLSAEARGKYFLYLDADISISGDIISEILDYMKKLKLAMVSVFPKQLMHSTGERLTVPCMNWILLSLLPLPMVRLSKKPSLAAANGQFIMFDALVYAELRPHEMVKKSLVEDIEMMRRIKKLKPDKSRRRSLKNRYRTAVLTGDRRISCRMYRDYKDAVHGFSKNVLHFFGNSIAWTLIFLFLCGPVIVFLFLHSLAFGLMFIAAGVLNRLFISLTSRQNALYNIFLGPVQQLYLYYIVYKAVRIKFSGTYTWKGRKIKT